MPEESQKAKDGLKALKLQYAKLLKNQRSRMQQDPGYKLKVMQKRLEDMFQLLNIWQQYVDIIYAPEHEINMLKIMKDNGLYSADSTDDVSFASKMENENIESRLATLFARDEQETEKDIDQSLADPYMSVLEGATTDTQATTDVEGDLQEARGSVDKEEGIQSEDEGIASEEEEAQEEKHSSTEFNKTPIFKTDRVKDDVEHQFNFDDQDVDRFTEKIQSKFDEKQNQKVRQTQEDDDEDFISQAPSPGVKNMQKLDLFGVPLDTLEGTEETLKERNDKRRFVQDLLQVMEALDTESDPDGVGLVQDFSKAKTFVHFDPY